MSRDKPLTFLQKPHTFLRMESGLLVAFYDTLGIRRTHSRLNPRRPHGGQRVKDISIVELTHKITILIDYNNGQFLPKSFNLSIVHYVYKFSWPNGNGSDFAIQWS